MKVRAASITALVLFVASAVLPVGAQEGAIATVVPSMEVEPPTEAPEVEVIEPDPVPPRPGLTRTDHLWASRLCAHEATWAGRVDGTADCGGIVQVVLNRMLEHEADGGRPETFTQRLSYTSPRFWAGTTTRAWARLLPAGALRAPIAGWPTDWPAPSNYTDRWHSVYTHTGAYMTGREALPCDGTPTHWLGRRTDRRHLATRLASGRWREVTCVGEGDLQERNAFLERVPVPAADAAEASEPETTEEPEILLGG